MIGIGKIGLTACIAHYLSISIKFNISVVYLTRVQRPAKYNLSTKYNTFYMHFKNNNKCI